MNRGDYKGDRVAEVNVRAGLGFGVVLLVIVLLVIIFV